MIIYAKNAVLELWQTDNEVDMLELSTEKKNRQANIAQWLMRQNFRYSWGQGKIPNPLEVAVVTLVGIQSGILTAILAYTSIFFAAWLLGFIGEAKGWIQYEQRYASELNPILMEIRDRKV